MAAVRAGAISERALSAIIRAALRGLLLMSFDWRLLEILADGEFHSGEDLGVALGISRAAIWKQLQKLEDSLSVKIESVRGRGYCLVDPPELLNSERILSSIPRSIPYSLHILRQTNSTNTDAAHFAAQGLARGCVVLAEQQAAGRGRRGRKWVSPFARNIYCSLAWEFDAGAAALEGLSLAVGVAVVRALHLSGVEGVTLKWPNDAVHNERKLAGILLEMTGDVSGRCQVVVGVGINVSMSDWGGAEEIDQPWTDACTIAGRRVSRNELAANLIDALLRLLRDFEVSGFARFHEEWSALDCMRDKPVVVRMGDQVVLGTAAGVDASGALAVDTDTGRQWFYGGEVSLRLQG